MTNKLMEQIDALVEEKTFTLDAVKAITVLRTAALELQQQVEVLKALRDSQMQEIAQSRQIIDRQNEQIKEAVQAQKEAEKLADSYRQQGLEGKCAVAELRGYAAALNTVFKPSAVRETVHKSVTVPVQNNGFTSIQTFPESTASERSAE